jgi:RNA methyltransferase, TrmH family
MLSKNEVKYIQSLYHKKTRETEGVFVVEGPKMADELLRSGYNIKKIYATEDWLQPAGLQQDIITVKEDELQRLTAMQTANQVLVVAEQKLQTGTPQVKGQLTLVLDGIQDPGNLGTIIRIADWFGVQQVVASEDTVELYNPKVIQATMGSFIRVNTWYQDLDVFLESANVPVYGALLTGKNVFEMNRVEEGLLVIGNESKGINDAVKKMITDPVTIPKKGGAESLNAAVAAGIILSHIT